MFLQLKLILQKNNPKNIILIFSAIFIVLVVVNFSWNSCGSKHIMLVNDMNKYEQTLDPEYCEEILEKIDLFNETCEPKIEILDCG